jgi:hypothetical protein
MEKRIMHLSSPAQLLHRAMLEGGDSLALFNLAGREVLALIFESAPLVVRMAAMRS